MTKEYIAGFFDGEGSIHSKKNKVRIYISQTNEDVLNQIKIFMGFGKVYHIKKRKEHFKEAWVYCTTSSKDSYTFLEMTKEFLIVKKERTVEVLKLIDEYRKSGSDRDDLKDKAIQLVNSGKSYREAERLTGIGRQSICRAMKKLDD